MKIVLDSSVILSDLRLTSEKIPLLLQYAKRTEAEVLVPEIVLKEVEGHVERLIRDQRIALEEHFQLLAACSGRKPELPIEGSSSDLVKGYIKKLRERLRLSDSRVLKLKPEHLTPLVDRAVSRRKPLNNSGQQFRDGLIWESILDLCRSGKMQQVCLISANARDFGSPSGSLHSELANEAKSRDLEVKLYPSVDAFLREHADKIAFVTEEFIERLVASKELESEAIDYLNRHSRQLERWFERKHGASGSVDVTSIQLELDDFYVYSTGDGKLTVMAFFTGEAEVSGETHGFDHDHFDYRFRSKSAYPSVQVDVEMTLNGQELEDWSIVNSDVLS